MNTYTIDLYDLNGFNLMEVQIVANSKVEAVKKLMEEHADIFEQVNSIYFENEID